MPTLQHILFPFDFSSQSVQAAPLVQALARRFSARITLLSIVPPAFEQASEELDLRVGDNPTEWVRSLQTRLDQVLIDELAGLVVDRVAEAGDPALRIARFAHSHAVDLIMMPTHGQGVFRSLQIGRAHV